MAVYGVSLSLSLLRCLLAGVVVFAYGGGEEGGTSKEEDEGWRDPDLLLLCLPLLFFLSFSFLFLSKLHSNIFILLLPIVTTFTFWSVDSHVSHLSSSFLPRHFYFLLSYMLPTKTYMCCSWPPRCCRPLWVQNHATSRIIHYVLLLLTLTHFPFSKSSSPPLSTLFHGLNCLFARWLEKASTMLSPRFKT